MLLRYVVIAWAWSALELRHSETGMEASCSTFWGMELATQFFYWKSGGAPRKEERTLSSRQAKLLGQNRSLPLTPWRIALVPRRTCPSEPFSQTKHGWEASSAALLVWGSGRLWEAMGIFSFDQTGIIWEKEGIPSFPLHYTKTPRWIYALQTLSITPSSGDEITLLVFLLLLYCYMPSVPSNVTFLPLIDRLICVAFTD